MNGWPILRAWDFYPSVVIGCVLVLAAYFWSKQWKPSAESLNFSLGVLCIFLALCSPLDALADTYLFSAHMLQHMLLHLVAPAYMVAALPQSWIRSLLRIPVAAAIERLLSNPLLALIIAVGTFWVWHLPQLYNATIDNERMHIFEHLTLLASGFILWWPVWKPIEGRLTPSTALGYVLAVAVADGLLGVIFSIADTPYYAAYAHPRDELRVLPFLRDKLGLTQLSDQKLGGAIMWGLGSVIFLWVLIEVMVRWFFEHPEHEAPQTVPESTD